MKKEILNTFLEYVKIDTQANSSSSTKPSTKKQFKMLDLLEEQLLDLNLDTTYDKDNGYVYGILKGNVDTYKIGFVAHVDTAQDTSGKDVKPKVFENYDGGILKLNDNDVLDPKRFKELKNYIGQTIITTSGDTLLGADDKAGVTEIIHTLKFIKANNISHGDIYVAFTTDEEIGKGVVNFNTDLFNPDFAYTLDGGEIGELQYENFYATNCEIQIEGINVHPGNAKNKMVNSQELGIAFHNLLPKNQRPEFTKLYEGFFLLTRFDGTIDKTNLSYLIRDHDKIKFENMKKLFLDNFNSVIKNNSSNSTLIFKDRYRNMYEVLQDKMYIIDLAFDAFKDVGVNPIIRPIRGGTDGANLSFKGIPCPNIFTGGHNFHGKYEYIPLESMEKAVLCAVQIIKLSTTKYLKKNI